MSQQSATLNQSKDSSQVSIPLLRYPMSKPLDIFFLVDRSNSMQSMGDKVSKSFNKFIHEQQEVQATTKRQVMLTTLTFDDRINIVHDRCDIQDITPCNPETFQPRGMTALFDAVLTGLEMIDVNHKTMKTQVLFVILTDGEENASTKMTSIHEFNKLIQYKRKQGFEFVFLGANQDAIKTGSQLGFPQQSCLTFIANETSCMAMMDRVSKQIQRSISLPASQVEFSQMDREVSQSADLPKFCQEGITTWQPNHATTSALDLNKFLNTSSKTTCDTCDTDFMECSQLPDDSIQNMQGMENMQDIVNRKRAKTDKPRFKRFQTFS